jgi:hypothetical protein
MKQIIFLAITCITLNASAQISLPGAKKDATGALSQFIAPPAFSDVGKTASSIGESLITQLALPSAKKPELESAIGSFLTDKKGIMGLAQSNPANYLTKFNPLQKGLFGKFKTIMGAAAFGKFMGLKPSGKNISGNVLSNLFF